MKLRNVVIVLLAIFMVFAFASCSNEPKNNPQPGPTGVNQTYRLTATKSRVDKWYTNDKFALDFTLLDGFSVKENDVISFSYRSTMEFEEYSIRHGDYCWVYEDSKDALTTYELGEDGWIKVSYKFGPKCFLKDNQVPRSEWELEPVPYPETFRFDLRGYVFAGDILEIKDLALNGNYLTLTQNMIASDYCAPTLVVVDENTPAFPGARDFAVIYGEGSLSNSNAPLSYELVEEGGKVANVPTRDHYTISLYTTSDATKQNEETLFNPAEATITKDTVLYIVAVPETYKVTYVYNNGSENTVVDAEYGSLLDVPDNPQYLGKLFAGWFTDKDLSQPFDFDTAISGDVTLYAKYGDPITVTFNTQAEGITVEQQTIAEGTTATEPDALERENYRFDGWFTAATCKDSEKFDFETVLTENTVLYAGWTEAKVVTFNANFGENPETITGYAIPGQPVAEPTKVLQRSGFVFDGWYKEAACTTPYDFNEAVTENMTLYANWSYGTTYRLTSTKFTSTDGNSDDKFVIKWGNTTVNVDDVLSLSFRTTEPFTQYSIRGDKKWFHEKDSSYFTSFVTGDDGWTTVTYKFPSSGTAETITYPAWFMVYFRNQKMVPGAIMEIRAITLNGVELTVEAGNIESYAAPTLEVVETPYEWTKQTVTFNTDGGTEIGNASVDFGQRVGRPEADPVKADVDFINWYADAEFTKVFDFKNTPITKATTIYAKYGAPTLVTFNSNGGSAVESKTVPAGTPVTKPADPKKEGQFFAGWFTDADCTTPYDFDAEVTEEITLYALWADPVNLTYDLNYTGAAEASVTQVGKGLALTAPNNPTRPGLYFDGWYEDKDYTTQFDFASGITEAKTIFAKWSEPESFYRFTATLEKKRIAFRYAGDSGLKINPVKGDVITFKYKTPEGKNIDRLYLRNYDGSSSTKLADGGSSSLSVATVSGPDKDGWYSFSVTFGDLQSGKEATYPFSGFLLELIYSGYYAVGDVIEILGFAYNGKELVIANDYHKGIRSTESGAGDDMKPTMEIVSLVPTV